MINKLKLKKIQPYLFISPTLIITIVFVVYPIFNSVIRSFNVSKGAGFTFDNYKYFFSDPIMIKNLWYTIYISIATVIITLIVSYPFAIYVRFSKSKISKWLYNLLLMPRFIPGMVAVYAIKQIIGDIGFFSRLGTLFGQKLQLGLMYTANGIIYTNIWFNIPFSVLIIASSLANIKKSNLDSARDVGAGNWTIFKNIILPLSYKNALVSSTFIFMSNIGAFTTPYLMGGNSPKMYGVVLNDIFSVYREYEKASALSVIMFLICLVSAAIYIYTNLRRDAWEKK